jgi:hypothetical protein
MHRSCLLALLTVVVLSLAAVIAWRQTHQSTATVESAPAAVSVTTNERQDLGTVFKRLLGLDRQPTPVPLGPEVSETMAAGFAGTPGLAWKLTRPLPLAVSQVGGLAADEEAFYVSSYDSHTQTSTAWRLDARTLRVTADLEEAAWVAGGMGRGSAYVWLALMAPAGEAAEGSATPTPAAAAGRVVGLDPGSLTEQISIDCDLAIRAVVEDGAGRLTGVSDDGQWLVQWAAADGQELQRRPNPTGATYHDMAYVGGSLVAGAGGDEHGWLDVIDPDSLTLLVRRRTDVRLGGQ